MPLKSPKNPKRVKGAASALIAKAIKINSKSKVIFLDRTCSSKAFYEGIGFITTNHHSYPATTMKLENAHFSDFIEKRASKVTFCEGSATGNKGETDSKKDQK